jgi:hypothetical protein
MLLNPAVLLFMGEGCTVVLCEHGQGVSRGIILDDVLDNLDLWITGSVDGVVWSFDHIQDQR